MRFGVTVIPVHAVIRTVIGLQEFPISWKNSPIFPAEIGHVPYFVMIHTPKNHHVYLDRVETRIHSAFIPDLTLKIIPFLL